MYCSLQSVNFLFILSRCNAIHIPHIGVDKDPHVVVYLYRWIRILCEFVEILTALFWSLMGKSEEKIDIGLIADSRWTFLVDPNNLDVTDIFQVDLLLVIAHQFVACGQKC